MTKTEKIIAGWKRQHADLRAEMIAASAAKPGPVTIRRITTAQQNLAKAIAAYSSPKLTAPR